MKTLVILPFIVVVAGCAPKSPRHIEPVLSPAAAASFTQLIDYPKGEVASIKAALSALDGKVSLTGKTNVYIEFRGKRMDVIFYPTPPGERVGGDGTYIAKVILERDSLETIGVEIQK
jgi:hypothetical protein